MNRQIATGGLLALIAAATALLMYLGYDTDQVQALIEQVETLVNGLQDVLSQTQGL